MKRSFFVAVALLLVAAPLPAVTFSVVRNGTAVPKAEVCWWKAGGSSNPVARLFVAGGIVCVAAGINAALPPGDVNVFARAGGLVSEETLLFTASNRPMSGSINVVPAVSVDVRGLALAEGEHAFAYFPRTASAIPLDAKALVPADSLVVPIVVAGRGIVRVGADVTTKSGKTAVLENSPRSAAHFDAVVPLRFASVPKGKAGALAVTATDAKGRAHASRTPLVPKRDSSAVAFVRDIPAGATTITLHGERWKSASWKIDADAQRIVAVVDPPLVANATSRFSVHWWTPVDLTSYKFRNDKCAESEWDDPPEPGKSFSAILLRCPDQKRGLGIGGVDRSTCEAVAEEPLPLDNRDGVVQFDDIAAGLYFLQVTVPGLPPIFKSVEVTADETSSADTELRYASFFGKVTRGGKPVHARVFETTTDPETGRYDAVLLALPHSSVPIHVAECGGAWTYNAVSDTPPTENAAFDIDVPENRIVVHVTDAPSGAPIGKARVRYAALMPGEDDAAHFAGVGGEADANGEYVIAPVLKNRRLSVCAEDPTHDSKCAELFTMGDTTEKSIAFALDRTVKREGQITGVGSVQFGMMMWFSRTGQMTEMLQFSDPEGKFTYRKAHAEGEIVVFTAKDSVLYGFVQPRIEEGSLFIINVPAARRRTFSVSLAQSSREEFAAMALLVGDVIVPENGVAQHLMLQSRQPSLEPGWTATIPDVVETGPISVILLPYSAIRRYQKGSGFAVELPLVPEWTSFPRKALGEGDGVVFE